MQIQGRQQAWRQRGNTIKIQKLKTKKRKTKLI